MSEADRFPIVPNSPESAYLEDLVGYLNALVKDASSQTTAESAFAQMMTLVGNSPLNYEAKKRIRRFYLEARQRPFFDPSDLVIEGELLKVLLKDGHEEPVRQLASYTRALVEVRLKNAQVSNPEGRLRAEWAALVHASPFRHWRVRNFFKARIAQGMAGTLDHDKVREELNAFWQACEEESLVLRNEAEAKFAKWKPRPAESKVETVVPTSHAVKIVQWKTETPLEKLRELAGHVKGLFGKPSEPVEESLSYEMIDAATASMPDDERTGREMLGGVDDAALDSWAEGAGKAERTDGDDQAVDIDFVRGEKCLEAGDPSSAKNHFRAVFMKEPMHTKSLKGILRAYSAILGAYRERGMMSEAARLFQEWASGLLEGQELADRCRAWNFIRRSLQIDVDLFSKEDSGALRALIDQQAQKSGQVVIYKLYWPGYHELVAPLATTFEKGVAVPKDEASTPPSARPAKRDIREILTEDHGVLLDWGHFDINEMALHVAATIDAKTMKALLKHGVDPDLEDTRGETLLLQAASCGNPEMVKALLEGKADPDWPDQDGWTPLMRAVHMKNFDAARVLIEGGAQVDKPGPNGRTVLIMTAAEGKADVVVFLMEHKADVNHQDQNGQTSLMEAAYWGHTETVTALLGAGARVDLRNREGLTAWEMAEMQNRSSLLARANKAEAAKDAPQPSPERQPIVFGGMGLVRRSSPEGKYQEVYKGERQKGAADYNFIKPDGSLFSEKWFTRMKLSEGILNIFLEDGRHNYLNADGQWLSAEGFEWACDFRQGVANVMGGGRWHAINTKGEEAQPLPEATLAKKGITALSEVLLPSLWGNEPAGVEGQSTPQPEEKTDPHIVLPLPIPVPSLPIPLSPLPIPVPSLPIPLPPLSSHVPMPEIAVNIAPVSMAEVAPRPQKEAPSKVASAFQKEATRLFGILALGKNTSDAERNELEGAVRDFMALAQNYPGVDFGYREFIPMLRRLWKERKVSNEILALAHKKDLEFHSDDFETIAELALTQLEYDTMESLKTAKELFQEALRMQPEPTGRHTSLREYLARIPGRIERLRKLGLDIDFSTKDSSKKGSGKGPK